MTLCVLAGCATRQRDNFYTLDVQPATVGRVAQFTRHVTVRVTIPAIIDRGEMVLTTPAGIEVLDLQRWAAPLADLFTATLGQDIERQRADVLVVSQSTDNAGVPLFKIVVDVDAVTARRAESVTVELRWRVIDGRAGKTAFGRDIFIGRVQSDSYAALAQALSSCVSQLAERLVKELPAS